MVERNQSAQYVKSRLLAEDYSFFFSIHLKIIKPQNAQGFFRYH